MIAATLSSFVLAGVVSAFLMVSRISCSELSHETGNALDVFAQDSSHASDIRWHNS